MKRFFALLLMITALMTLLPACGDGEIPDGPAELWVVTEPSKKNGMNEQAEEMIKIFQETYPDVTVRLDVLPIGTEERAVYLDSLRTQIMGGGGPDVFLMPTTNWVYDRNESIPTMLPVEPLFRDVTQCMYNGIFADISEYYDADDTLGKEAFTPGVMNAGVLDGTRYVLPLRYSCRMIMADASAGYDLSMFDGGIDAILEYMLQQNDEKIHYGLLTFPDISSFSNLVDYKTGKITLTAQEVADIMKLYQAVWDHIGPQSSKNHGNYNFNLSYYLEQEKLFSLYGYPFACTTTDYMLEAAAVAKLAGEEIDAVPVRTADGDVLAQISYFGAVSAGCPYPKLAYEFLRLFLSEEAQWEQYPSRKGNPSADGLAESSWPVRSVGSVQPLFENMRIQKKALMTKGPYAIRNPRERAFLDENFTLTDEDFPGLSIPVDIARFPIIQEEEDSFYHYTLQLLTGDHTYSDAEIDALAQQVIEELEKYVSEG